MKKVKISVKTTDGNRFDQVMTGGNFSPDKLTSLDGWLEFNTGNTTRYFNLRNIVSIKVEEVDEDGNG